MYFIIYQTTNLFNGRFYIGKHQTKDINDGYLGSGKALTSAIKKHGKQSFAREILKLCESKEEMDRIEESLVTEDLLKDPKCYNIRLGGTGGFDHIWKNPETRKKLIKAKQGPRNSFYGKTHTVETRLKISISQKERLANGNPYRHSEESKFKIAIGNSKPKETYECAHCGALVKGKTNLVRWHNGRCHIRADRKRKK